MRYVVANLFQPMFAHRHFPCFSEPRYKATFNLTILRKAPLTSLSNMPMKASKARIDGWTADTFETTQPMTVYTLSIFVGSFNHRTVTTKRGLKIRLWARSAMMPSMTFALQMAPKIIDYLEEYTSSKFPLPKLDIIMVMGLTASGMENWGAVIYQEESMACRRCEETSHWDHEKTGRSLRLLAHELAHQWFGNLLTISGFDDVWQNEGFATYFSTKITAALLKNKYDLDGAIHKARVEALMRDIHPFSMTMRDTVYNPEKLLDIFDSIAYAKGHLLLRMLNHVIGEDTFRKVIRHYVTSNAFTTVTYRNFIKSLQKVIPDEDLRRGAVSMVTTWLTTAGHPIVTADYSKETGVIRISQERLEACIRTPKKNVSQSWTIPYSIGVLGTNVVGPNFLLAESTNITLPYHSRNNIFVILDPGVFGAYRVNYDANTWTHIAETVANNYKVIPRIQRIRLLDDAIMLSRLGKMKPIHVFMIATWLKHETTYDIWKTFLDYVDDRWHCFRRMMKTYMCHILPPALRRRHHQSNQKGEDWLYRLLRRNVCKYNCPMSEIYIGHCKEVRFTARQGKCDFRIWNVLSWLKRDATKSI
ncbi:glutamyl aminopeptidase-like [Lineus longissimus]|uniref:glutamyl aminopeptidase-like n=1 Tax=Lineus longissimus TaxID=88925 RepID=UPI00315CC27A